MRMVQDGQNSITRKGRLLPIGSRRSANPIPALFTNGERGVYYDPSDLTTLFQDAAGTTPVTAPGQPVGLVLDKSGRGNHASQPTAAARPTLGRHPKGVAPTPGVFDQTIPGVPDAWYLHFNGVNQSLSTPAIDFTNSDEMMVVAGLRKTTTGTAGVVVELGAGPPSGAGIFTMFAPHPPVTGNPLIQFRWWSNLGNSFRVADDIEAAKASPYSGIVTGSTKGNGPIRLRVNSKVAPIANTSLSGNFGNFPLHIGARTANSIYFGGNIYGMVVCGKVVPDQELSDIEFHMANQVGVQI